MRDSLTSAMSRISWQTASVLIAVIAAIVIVWVTSPDHRGDILAALGTVGALLLAVMRPMLRGPSLALLVALGASGCGASALRTHQTIATIARVSVVAAHPAIVSTCETLTSRCTDVACVERVTADCDAAGTARDVAHAAVRAYVDTIEIAARADEGQVAAALDLALQTVANAYDAARTTIARLTGYQLPELPPIAVTILRALAAQVVPGGAS